MLVWIVWVNIKQCLITLYLDRKFNIAAPYIREGISKLGNIGKTPEMDNTEINSETKESESSYSVEVEPNN